MPVVVNAVEPVDSMTLKAQEALAFERSRVLGVGGLLSSTRMRYLVASALGVSPREVTALVVGPDRRDMVVLRDSVRVSGIPAEKLLGTEKFEAIIEEVRTAGDTILRDGRRSPPPTTPPARPRRPWWRPLCATRARPCRSRTGSTGEYEVNDIRASVPAQIGARGVRKIIDVGISEAERQQFLRATAELKTAIERVTGQLPQA